MSGSVVWSDSHSEFTAPLFTRNCHCHYSCQCHSLHRAQSVRDAPQEYGKRVDKKPVTCDYENIFKGYTQANAIQSKSPTTVCRDGQENLLLALKERPCGLDIRVEILREQSFPPDISHRLTALCVACKLMESMATDRLGHFLGSRFFFVDNRSEFGRGQSLMDNVMALKISLKCTIKPQQRFSSEQQLSFVIKKLYLSSPSFIPRVNVQNPSF